MAASLCVDNVFTRGFVNTSSEAADFPKENIFDWKQYDWWKPESSGDHWVSADCYSNQTCDYIAVFGHNLHQVGGNVKAQYSSDGVSWSDAAGAVYPTTGRIVFVRFTAISARYWRVRVSTTDGVAAIAGVMIGARIAIDVGFAPGLTIPALAAKSSSRTGMSEMGVNLGASIVREGVEGTIQLTNVTASWFRGNMPYFIEHFNAGLPAVFCWNDDYTSDALLIWRGDDELSPPRYVTALLMGMDIKFNGIR